MAKSSRLLLLGATLALSACGGAGPYGHARTYEPLAAERDALAGATEVSYEDVRRSGDDYAGQTVSFFGIVRHVAAAEGGVSAVQLDFRILQPRNLCADETASSCRVTVSERSGGPFTAKLTILPEDQAGRGRLGPGSLVRVYGTPTGELDEEGGPILEGRYYRHWPHGQYVTTADAGRMRR